MLQLCLKHEHIHNMILPPSWLKVMCFKLSAKLLKNSIPFSRPCKCNSKISFGLCFIHSQFAICQFYFTVKYFYNATNSLRVSKFPIAEDICSQTVIHLASPAGNSNGTRQILPYKTKANCWGWQSLEAEKSRKLLGVLSDYERAIHSFQNGCLELMDRRLLFNELYIIPPIYNFSRNYRKTDTLNGGHNFINCLHRNSSGTN